jgi:predicted MFS family arabinose efflux permease
MSARAAPGALRLATAGIGVVGVSFGMARYGYGLLLPDVRREYGLSPALLGAIATGSYAMYLAATALTGAFTERIGARRTAVAAGLLAAAGMAIAGLSRSPAVFVTGVLIAGASAGLAFAPFADAARSLAPAMRGRVVSAISCGTGYGVALAAPIAIVAGAAWRSAWLAFAAAALAAAWWAAHVLPGVSGTGEHARARGAWRTVLCRRALPLLVGGLLVGLGSSAYWTFAVEHLSDAGALSPTASRTFLGVVGVASVVATLSGDLVRRLGPRPAYLVSAGGEAGALALLAIAPSSLAAALVSGVAFGAAYSAVIAIQVLWGTHLFATRPSLGAAAVMVAGGTGFAIGPLVAGLLAGPLGLGAVLLLGAGLVASAALLAPREAILARQDVRRHAAVRASSPPRTPARR